MNEPQVEERMGPATVSPHRMKVVYIGGLGRSGSTLLDRMLGQLPDFWSCGEIRDLWQRGLVENRLCGCGKPFRECPFWSRVGAKAFGGWDDVDVERVLGLVKSVDRHSRIPFLVAPRAWPSFARQLDEYLGYLNPLFQAIHEAAEGRIIVDSSKAPSTAFILRRVQGVDLRVVHLIRDSRGVAYSWHKKVVRPDTPGKVTYMHRYAPPRIAARWVTRNLLMEGLSRLGNGGVRVRYENLVADPRHELQRILRMVDEGPGERELGFVTDHEVRLEMGHTVMGNPVRMHQGPLKLRLDDEWTRSMSDTQRRIVSLVSAPLLLRYGYPI